MRARAGIVGVTRRASRQGRLARCDFCKRACSLTGNPKTRRKSPPDPPRAPALLLPALPLGSSYRPNTSGAFNRRRVGDGGRVLVAPRPCRFSISLKSLRRFRIFDDRSSTHSVRHHSLRHFGGEPVLDPLYNAAAESLLLSGSPVVVVVGRGWCSEALLRACRHGEEF